MKKNFFALLGAAILIYGCSEKKPLDEGQVAGKIDLSEILVLNNGSWGQNNSSLSLYDVESRTCTGEAFFAANEKRLGDTAQDLIRTGNNVLISVSESQVIFVLRRKDLASQLQLTVEQHGICLSPRQFAAGEDKIYVTYYEGFLGEIDTRTWAVKTTEVGPNPEGLAYCNGKIYVANSGGYVDGFNNTVSVVEANSFHEVSTIEVNTNPDKVIAVGDYVYVTSRGNYADIPSKLQRIDSNTGEVKDLDFEGVCGMALGKDGIIYVLCGENDESWQLQGRIYKYDTVADKNLGLFADGIKPAYSIGADSESGVVFVGCSDYVSNGDVLVYDKEGRLYDKFDSQGLNPIAFLAW